MSELKIKFRKPGFVIIHTDEKHTINENKSNFVNLLLRIKTDKIELKIGEMLYKVTAEDILICFNDSNIE